MCFAGLVPPLGVLDADTRLPSTTSDAFREFAWGLPQVPEDAGKGLRPATILQPLRHAEEPEEVGNSLDELRCVCAVIRHGDRTPKQKLKMTVRLADRRLQLMS